MIVYYTIVGIVLGNYLELHVHSVFNHVTNILLAATVWILEGETYWVASSPISLIFSTHARKEEESCIQNHVHDADPYTRV